MPVYEYVCKSCDHEFEREQRITEDPIKTCPACGARKAKRLISRTAFVLKGGGWYSDLYSSSASKSEKPAGKGDAAGGDKADSAAAKTEGGGKTDGGGAASGKDAKGGKTGAGGKAKTKGSGGGGAKGSKAA